METCPYTELFKSSYTTPDIVKLIISSCIWQFIQRWAVVYDNLYNAEQWYMTICTTLSSGIWQFVQRCYRNITKIFTQNRGILQNKYSTPYGGIWLYIQSRNKIYNSATRRCIFCSRLYIKSYTTIRRAIFIIYIYICVCVGIIV